MADWNHETQRATFDATSYTTDMVNSRQATRIVGGGSTSDGGFVAWLTSKFDKTGRNDYSLVGIQVESIPAMQKAITDYVLAIQDHLDKIEVSTEVNVALKGSGIEESVKGYVRSVSDYCKALISNLLAFNDKLTKVREAWEATDRDMASSVNGTSDEVASISSNSYQEQFK